MFRWLKKKKQSSNYRPVERVIGFVFDHDEKIFISYTDDILINQIKRDSLEISESFDKLCDEQIQDVSDLFSHFIMALHKGNIHASKSNDLVLQACIELLLNAATSFSAAIAILRLGYRLQPGILIRNILETICTAIHIFNQPEDLKSFQDGELKSSKTIKSAKSAIPIIGKMYGYFSDEFTHLGYLHRNKQPLIPYTKTDDSLRVNITMIRQITWLLYLSAELICHSTIDNPRYWKSIEESEGGYQRFIYDPSESEREWQKTFLEKNLE